MDNKKYTVKQGDTLVSLAKTFYNDPIHADSLRKINQIAPQDDVRVAMDIMLPLTVASLGPSENVGDKMVKHIYYGKLQDTLKYLFPLPKQFQDKGYHSGARSFGYSRGDRAHAACDLYALLSTPIYAVADGIIKDYHFFYWKTFCLEVDHDEFSIVYGEVQPPADPENFGIVVTNEVMKYILDLRDDEKKGLPNDLKKGSKVTRGQHIAFVGQLYKDNGSVPFENTMLHFEKYNNKASGPFTQKTNTTDYLNVVIKPYKRRKDLEDPTEFIDKCEPM